MVLRNLALAVLVVFPLAASGGQAPDGPAFEVISIRPVKPVSVNDFDFNIPDVVRLVGDRLQATNTSALGLIRAAYRSEYADRDQIIDADGWIASERFDVEARAATLLTETRTTPPLPRAAEVMLRQLLEQRFQLRVRSDRRELPRLVLTHARPDRSLKNGIRISDQDCTEARALAQAGQCAYYPFPGKLTMRGRPMQHFVDFLSVPAYSGVRVVDGTGITGNVDVDLEWMLDWKDLLISRANLMTAVQEQLGLKLESRRLSLPVLIIEDIRRPSGN